MIRNLASVRWKSPFRGREVTFYGHREPSLLRVAAPSNIALNPTRFRYASAVGLALRYVACRHTASITKKYYAMQNLIDLIVKNFTDIAVVLLTAAVGAHFIWRNNFKTRRATACAVFRSSVLAELGTVYPHPSAWPENIDAFLRSHFTALQSAVENFRPFVPWWNRWRFDRAWFRYRCATGRKVDVQCYHHYMAFGDNPNYKAIFHSNVSDLLRFANET